MHVPPSEHVAILEGFKRCFFLAPGVRDTAIRRPGRAMFETGSLALQGSPTSPAGPPALPWRRYRKFQFVSSSLACADSCSTPKVVKSRVPHHRKHGSGTADVAPGWMPVMIIRLSL